MVPVSHKEQGEGGTRGEGGKCNGNTSQNQQKKPIQRNSVYLLRACTYKHYIIIGSISFSLAQQYWISVKYSNIMNFIEFYVGHAIISSELVEE